MDKSTSQDNLYAVIMAGGEGTRFAPLSTPEKPKQFLNFIGDKTFVRQTFDRVSSLVDSKNVYVSTNARYVDLVKEQLPEVQIENIIGEPRKKNTAPALVYTVMQIFNKNPDATVICLPSDHFIKDEVGFREVLGRAVKLAGDDYLVTLGMAATWASPEYGYIAPSTNSAEWSPVSRFIEKPTPDIAAQYINDGYFWNGGIFIWKAKTLLEEVKLHAPELVANGYGDPINAYFDAAPSISIDYAVMEKSNRVAVVPTKVGWSDIGTWESLRRLWVGGDVCINSSVLQLMNRGSGGVSGINTLGYS